MACAWASTTAAGLGAGAECSDGGVPTPSTALSAVDGDASDSWCSGSSGGGFSCSSSCCGGGAHREEGLGEEDALGAWLEWLVECHEAEDEAVAWEEFGNDWSQELRTSGRPKRRASGRDLARAVHKAENVRLQIVARRHRVCSDIICRRGRRHGSQQRQPCEQNFSALRRRFMNQYADSLRSDLLAQCPASVNAGRSQQPGWYLLPTVHMDTAPLSEAVQNRFLSEQRRCVGAAMVPTYHGTNPLNFKSIFGKGLLVPSHSTGVAVANGQCHGAGIYTARCGAAFLAMSFTRSVSMPVERLRTELGGCPVATWTQRDKSRPPAEAPPPPPAAPASQLLVCAVIDDSQPVPPRRIGNFQLTAESKSVSHVGDAIVVADECRVAPLFVATMSLEPCWMKRAPRASHNRAAAGRKALALKVERNCVQELALIDQCLEKRSEEAARRVAKDEARRLARETRKARETAKEVRAQARVFKLLHSHVWPHADEI
mmetsp:Transcript_33739/g.86421  ORF Transcript_33739/g.86421 Transcript_33739/m.86421 type:complete len:488 (-) Transcript_33739:404-1867(-)